MSPEFRDGNSIAFTLDALNRVTAKNLPGSEPDVTYTYDLLNRMTGASQTGNSLTFTYDALGRQLTQAGPHGTITSTWDLAGRRTRITHPDSFYVDQEYLVTGDMTVIRENGATSGAGVLATYAYDDLGRRTSLTRGNGSVLSYSHDNVSRLTQLSDNLSGTTYDQTLGFSYNPASGIVQTTRSNDLYAWGGHYNVNRNYTSNGLNQFTASGSITPTYDSKGNLTSAGSTTFGYSSENLLTSATGNIALSYDPLIRLYQTVGSVTTRLAYDGNDLVLEYDGNNALQRRYVHGPGTNDPVAWYEGSGTTDRRFLHADERGSILAVTNSSGTIIGTNKYDEYGIPAAANLGRFQYTGQAWLSDLSIYYYKARLYSPTLGRFLQTDPIGYGDGMNLYAYVKSDPANKTDSTGLCDDGLGELCGATFENNRKLSMDEDASQFIKVSNLSFGLEPRFREPWRNACLDVNGCSFEEHPAMRVIHVVVSRVETWWNDNLYNSALSRCTRARPIETGRATAQGAGLGLRSGTAVGGPAGGVGGATVGGAAGANTAAQKHCGGPGQENVGRRDPRGG